jgi:hypothetical protein
VPQSDLSRILIGQPVEPDLDVGLALRKGLKVTAFVFSGSSVLAPGSTTSVVEVIDRILSPLASNEVGTIRCIGLNVSEVLPLTHRYDPEWLRKDFHVSTNNMPPKSSWKFPLHLQFSCKTRCFVHLRLQGKYL